MSLVLAEYAIESAAALMIGWIATSALRRHSAAVRASAWAATFAVVVGLVPFTMVRPIVPVTILPRSWVGGEGRYETNSMAYGRASRSWQTGSEPSDAAPVLAASAKPKRTSPALSWTSVILAAWAAGTLALIARLVLGRIRLARLRRASASIACPRVLAMAGDVHRSLGMRGGSVQLLSSPVAATPLAFGVLRPTVLLPAGAESWSEGRLRSTLTHELAHLKRRDPMTQLLGEVAGALHWYNPLVWQGLQRLSLERERACDDEVVRAGTSRLDYAEHVLWVAQAARRPQLAWVPLTMARTHGLEERITALLRPGSPRGSLTRAQRWALAAHTVAVLFLFVAIGSAPASAVRAGHPPGPLSDGGRGEAGRVAAAIAPGREPAAIRRSSNEVEPVRSSTPRLQARGPSRLPQAGGEDGSLRAAALPSVTPAPTAATPTDPIEADLSDPRSEYLAVPGATAPSEAALDGARDRQQILRLMSATRHEKQFEHDYVRERAQWALSRVRDGEVVGPLVESLSDPDWRARAYAAWALAAVDARAETARIQCLLDDGNWRVRAQAAASLADFGASLPIQTIERLASDPAWQVRIEAIELLRSEPGPQSRRVLERMRQDPHGGTRVQAEAALAERAGE